MNSLEFSQSGLDEDDEIAAAWAAEVERRIDEYAHDETIWVGVEEMIAAARARIRQAIPEE